jgi:hypothetical protein
MNHAYVTLCDLISVSTQHVSLLYSFPLYPPNPNFYFVPILTSFQFFITLIYRKLNPIYRKVFTFLKNSLLTQFLNIFKVENRELYLVCGGQKTEPMLHPPFITPFHPSGILFPCSSDSLHIGDF